MPVQSSLKLDKLSSLLVLHSAHGYVTCRIA